MRAWRFFGPDAMVTPIARMILEEDINGLEASLGRDWKLNERTRFSEHTIELPINLALVEQKMRVIDYLLSKGVDLNVMGAPAITFAVKNCDLPTIDKVIAAGAQIDAVNNVGSNAISCALYQDRLELLPFLQSKGLKLDADGGESFRQAVSAGQRAAVEYFLSQGFDPNTRVADMVHRSNPSAVEAAAMKNDFEMVKLLVEHGADVTLTDANGSRPYLWALHHNNGQMEAYLRALEPADWHDPAKKIELMRSYGAPEALIEFVQLEDRRINLRGEAGCEYLDISNLAAVYEFKWSGGLFLNLFGGVDDMCGCGELVWSKKRMRLALIDTEHDEITWLGSWADFIRDPGAALGKQFG
jgi:hypothetical protein